MSEEKIKDSMAGCKILRENDNEIIAQCPKEFFGSEKPLKFSKEELELPVTEENIKKIMKKIKE